MLAFKRTMYEKERNTLAQLRAERLSVELRRDSTERQFLERDAAFRQKAAEGGVGITEVTALSYQRESADGLIAALQEEMDRLEVEIEKQLVIVVALDKEVKSLEKLREKQWEEYQAETIREENERILEMVSSRFAAEQKENAESRQDD